MRWFIQWKRLNELGKAKWYFHNNWCWGSNITYFEAYGVRAGTIEIRRDWIEKL